MAITTDPWDATELAAYISETWTDMVIPEYFSKAVAANFFTDLSEYANEGSDIFHVPSVFTNAFSVQTQSTGGAEVTTEAPAAVDVTVTVDTHKYIATLLPYLQQVQVASKYNLSEIYNQKAGGTLMEDFESAILSLATSLSTNTIGDTATVLSDAEVRQAIEKLATADFPLEECAWFVAPFTYWVQLLAVQKYYDASQTGWAQSPTVDGNFGPAARGVGRMGTLYGIPLFTSSQITSALQTDRNILAHKTTWGFAHQTPGGKQVRVQAQNWLENLGILTVWDTIYGVAELNDAAGVLVNSNNVFIGS
jgi:hypothetical protein